MKNFNLGEFEKCPDYLPPLALKSATQLASSEGKGELAGIAEVTM